MSHIMRLMVCLPSWASLSSSFLSLPSLSMYSSSLWLTKTNTAQALFRPSTLMKTLEMTHYHFCISSPISRKFTPKWSVHCFSSSSFPPNVSINMRTSSIVYSTNHLYVVWWRGEIHHICFSAPPLKSTKAYKQLLYYMVMVGYALQMRCQWRSFVWAGEWDKLSSKKPRETAIWWTIEIIVPYPYS